MSLKPQVPSAALKKLPSVDVLLQRDDVSALVEVLGRVPPATRCGWR